MHVVVANNIYPPHMAGGAELIVAYLAEELATRGHQITVVTTCGPEMEPYPDEIKNGVKVIRFFPKNVYWNFDRANRPRWQKAAWHLRDAWNSDAAQRLRTLLSETPPDIFHTHLIDGMSGSIWRAAKRMGAGVIHTAHDYHLICPRAFMMTRDWKLCSTPKLSCRTYANWHIHTTRYVDTFTSPSQFLIDQHLSKGLRSRRTNVVANGIPLPPIAGTQGCASNNVNEPLRLLFAARMTVEKGVQVVLQAMRLIPADVRVEIDVAGRGELADQVESAAKDDPRIRFHGYVSGEQKHDLFNSVDCLLLPSLWYENAPVVVVEAGAYGLGVIGSNIGAIPEFISDGKNGLLFEPGDPQSLANVICKLAANRNLLQTFKHYGNIFAAHSTVANMADNYLVEYAKIRASHFLKA